MAPAPRAYEICNTAAGICKRFTWVRSLAVGVGRDSSGWRRGELERLRRDGVSRGRGRCVSICGSQFLRFISLHRPEPEAVVVPGTPPVGLARGPCPILKSGEPVRGVALVRNVGLGKLSQPQTKKPP